MPNALIVVSFDSSSGLPADQVTNSFAAQTAAGSLITHAPGIATAVRDFYNAEPSGDPGWTVGSFLSGSLSRGAGAMVLDVYDLTGHEDGSPHGSPVYSTAQTLVAPLAGTPLPEEVACCLTLRASAWSSQPVERPDADIPPDGAVDRPRQRRTGRLYIGPLVSAAIDASSGRPRVHSNLSFVLRKAALDLQADMNALGHNWSVWSRKEETLRNVQDVQVDNAFDTQRRRGPRSTLRDTQAV